MEMESLLSDYYDYNNDSDYNNETEEQVEEIFPQAHWILPTLYSIFFFFGLLGNALVIAVISRRSSRRADIFILNLAVSDMLFVLTLPLWASSLALGNYWPFGVHLCKTSGFTIAVTRCASSLLMACMSVDRYLAVMGGQKMLLLRTKNCSLGACCTIWAVSVLSGVPALAFRQLNEENGACVEPAKSSLIVGLKISTVLLTFVLPLIVVLFCYCCMARHLKKYFGRGKGTLKPRRGQSWLRIVTCVVAAYTFSWLPFNTLNSVAMAAQLNMDLPLLNAIDQPLCAAAALAFANSCTNPIIYFLLDAGFRRRAKMLIPRIFPACCADLLSPLNIQIIPAATGSAESGSTYTGSC
ncbi:probable G-protein coupled receptor 25 [Bombina bombina]|uniref:probable G-protein coupled receptor 25 n=1 Tax=Bombina bombina TaxID=8345 RepID=UPI00235A5206|nr:probable G-protein coupled receptor 25 [Bombina bombina]